MSDISGIADGSTRDLIRDLQASEGFMVRVLLRGGRHIDGILASADEDTVTLVGRGGLAAIDLPEVAGREQSWTIRAAAIDAAFTVESE